MSDLKQLNVEVEPELYGLVNSLAEKYGITRRATVELAIRATAQLTDRYVDVVAGTDEDMRELFMRCARLMPTWLVDQKVEQARFSDGRPALVVNKDWFVAPARDGELLVVRRDGRAAGHIKDGRIEVVRDRDLELAQLAALN